MPDQFDAKARSEIMAKVHSANTTPEKIVRGLLVELGVSFQTDNKIIKGKPDFLIPNLKILIFVHGCFWHGCPTCKHAQIRPKTNIEYWNKKLDRTLQRDLENHLALEQAGWRILVIWECETKKRNRDQLKKNSQIFFVSRLEFSSSSGGHSSGFCLW